MAAFARMQRRMLGAGGHRLRISSAIVIVLAGNAVSVSVSVAGAGLGAAFRYRQLKRRHVSDDVAAMGLVVSGVMSTLALMAVTACGALLSGKTLAGVFGAISAVAAIAGVAVVMFGLRVAACRARIERMAVAGIRIARRLRSMPGVEPEAVVDPARQRLADLHLGWADWATAAGFALLNWLCDAACLGLSLDAVDAGPALRNVLLVWSAGAAASSFGLTPGGIGIVDVALVAALAALGTPAAHAVVGVLIYRLISLWLVLLAGWILFLIIGFGWHGRLPRHRHPPDDGNPGEEPADQAPRVAAVEEGSR